MILLDTHVLIWALEDDSRLGRTTATQINEAAIKGAAAFAAITVWEIAMLVAKGRLALSCDVSNWIETAIGAGLQIMNLEPAIAIESNRLPGRFHADPADRMIVATARHHNIPLATADAAILKYAAERHVRVLDASA